MDRRAILIWGLRGVGMAIAGMVGIPSLMNAFSPILKQERGEEGAWQFLGALDDFPVGKMRKALVDVPRATWGESLRQKGVYAWRRSREELIVFSRNCTDLGCPVTWDPGSECFFCPCHGGIFAKNGERMAGPPNRPLFRYATRVRRGRVEIDLRSLPPVA
jgi:menaquinol-cytochrome c reductase iron-sulfur subunit